ncbi:hypothetical protein BC628DRAFT_1339653 [Trametes gibbosa]|nr:hypothetical protein BC628DRAFT_1339653 [Trametes gibbosa]
MAQRPRTPLVISVTPNAFTGPVIIVCSTSSAADGSPTEQVAALIALAPVAFVMLPFPFSKIQLWKVTSKLPEHEYLILCIAKDDNPNFGILRIERSVPNETVKDSASITSMSSESSYHSSTPTGAESSRVTREVFDFVKTYTFTQGNVAAFTAESNCIYTYTYPMDRPSITWLIAAADAVHTSNSNYILLHRQC